MKKFSLALLALATALAISPAALADTFDFTIQGGGNSASGVFTTGNVGSPYAITAISGMVDGSAINGLSSYAGADQLLYFPLTGGSYADFSGISFADASGVYYNIFNDGGNYLLLSTVDPIGYPDNGVPITMSVTATPEPGSLLLLGTGLLGLAFVAFRKAKPSGLTFLA